MSEHILAKVIAPEGMICQQISPGKNLTGRLQERETGEGNS